MKNGMHKALEYFENMGLPTKNGYIDSNLQSEQIQTLKILQENVNVDGVIMPNSMSKTQNAFEELYGRQEVSSTVATKVLHNNISEESMYKTYETVVPDEYQVFVPKLEILFVDKFLSKEKNPKNGRFEFELLAEEYELDTQLIEKYLNKYYLQIEADKKRKNAEKYSQSFVEILVSEIQRQLTEIDVETAMELVNQKIESKRGVLGDSMVNGINANMFILLTVTDVFINKMGEVSLSDEYIKKTKEYITEVTETEIATKKRLTLMELQIILEQMGKNRKNIDLSEYTEMAYDYEVIKELTIGSQAIKQATQEVAIGESEQSRRDKKRAEVQIVRNELNQAMYEVNVILDNTDKKLTQKISQQLMDIIRKTAKQQTEFKYNRAKNLKEQETSNIVKGILALIYRDYFCSEEQIMIYNEYYITVREKLECEKNRKHGTDKKHSKSNIIKEAKETTALVVYQKETIWTKIKNKLMRLFNR